MEHKTPRTPDFKKLLQRYTQRKTDEGLSIERIKHLGYMAAEVLAFLEQQEVLSVEEIKGEHLEAFMFRLRQRPHPRRSGGLSASYINKYRSAINSLMSFSFGTVLLCIPVGPFFGLGPYFMGSLTLGRHWAGPWATSGSLFFFGMPQ